MLREEEKHPRMSLVMGIHRYAEHLTTETKVLSSRDFDFFHYYQNRSFLVMCTTALMNTFILRLVLKRKKKNPISTIDGNNSNITSIPSTQQ